MADIFFTILPIFIVMLLGLGLRHLSLLPETFLAPANRLVYYVAIPAMIFREIAQADLAAHFRLSLVAATLVPVAAGVLAGWPLTRLFRMKGGPAATLNQGGFHGNLGYVGLAVALYTLGEPGLVQASLLAGFVMLIQNLLAVAVYQLEGGKIEAGGVRPGPWFWIQKVAFHPVILSALIGMAVSYFHLQVPGVVDRMLKIISGMSLPLALLLIGAGLSLDQMRGRWRPALGAAVIKLGLLPLLGWLLYRAWDIPAADYRPGLILLAAPTATLTYVMAREMGGDPELGTAMVSIGTLLSAVSYVFWLHLAG
jgi:predicted permease